MERKRKRKKGIIQSEWLRGKWENALHSSLSLSPQSECKLLATSFIKATNTPCYHTFWLPVHQSMHNFYGIFERNCIYSTVRNCMISLLTLCCPNINTSPSAPEFQLCLIVPYSHSSLLFLHWLPVAFSSLLSFFFLLFFFLFFFLLFFFATGHERSLHIHIWRHRWQVPNEILSCPALFHPVLSLTECRVIPYSAVWTRSKRRITSMRTYATLLHLFFFTYLLNSETSVQSQLSCPLYSRHAKSSASFPILVFLSLLPTPRYPLAYLFPSLMFTLSFSFYPSWHLTAPSRHDCDTTR